MSKKINLIWKQPVENNRVNPFSSISWLNDILWVNRLTKVETWEPNYLVPKWLLYNEISWVIFNYLKWKWVSFYLDTDKKSEYWYSDLPRKYIFLWLKTPRSYSKYMCVADNVDEDTKTQLVFLHEMCHHLSYDLFYRCSYFQELFNICKSIRVNNPNNWASKLADMKFYQNMWIDTQATEDCAELLRIYFMCRKNESMCFEYIKSKLSNLDNSEVKRIFNLLAESVMFVFPTW